MITCLRSPAPGVQSALSGNHHHGQYPFKVPCHTCDIDPETRKMKRRPTGRILAKRLLRLKKASGSWRAMRDEHYPMIPAGTLCRIALSNGEYMPWKPEYRAALNLPPRPCPTCNQRVTRPRQIKIWHDIQDLKPDELRWVFEHREEVTP